ncbi:MAG TPA: thiamine phosphate synthase, partial [Rickettsiales bacterium]|nr:thiamine phosphate synthase [Rickettsiales bacterium]
MISNSSLKIFDKNPDLGFVCAFFSDRKRVDLKKIAKNLPKNSAFIFREYDLAREKRQELAAEIFAICKKSGVKFLIGKDLDLAQKLGTDGIHFSDLDKIPVGAHRMRPRNQAPIISLSCHSLESLKNSAFDVFFLSPIFATKSHINAKILGLKNLEKACKSCSKPIFALGGINEKNLQDIRNCGARGFGGIDI